MKYIITNNDNVITNISNKVEELEDRYAVYDEHNRPVHILKEYKMQDIDGNITVNRTNVYEVEEIQEGVEPQKYCYTNNDGFYKNANYKEYYSEEDRISALEDMVNMLLLGGN